MKQPRPTPSYSRRQRAVMIRLTGLLADRAEIQGRLEAEYHEGVQEAAAAFEQIQTDLRDWRQHINETAGAEREQALAKVRPVFEEQLGAARRTMESEVAAFIARSNSMLNIAGGRFEEARWLADTLVESSESRARAQYDAVRKSVEKKKAEIDVIAEAARGMLAQAGHSHSALALQRATAAAGEETREAERTSGVPELGEGGEGGEGGRGEPGRPAPAREADVKTFLARLQEDCGRAAEALDRLERRVHPPALSVFGVLGGAAAAAGIAVLLLLWRVEDVQWGAASRIAGLTFVVAGAVMVALRLLARRRVPAAAASLTSALAAANEAAAVCLARAHADRLREIRQAHARREQELQEAQDQYMAVRRQVDQRRDVDGPRLRTEHEALIDGIQSEYSAVVEEIDGAHRKRTGEAGDEHDRRMREAVEAREQRLEELEAARDSTWRQLERRWHEEMGEIRGELEDLGQRAGALWPAWENVGGGSCPETLPPAARFGLLNVDLAAAPGGVPDDPRLPLLVPRRFEMPATLDLLGRGSLLLEHPTEARARAIAALNAVMLRLLTTFPPGKVRFTILDPVGLGESFAAFMHLADYEPALVSDRIWTDARHIETKLADLTEHMETVIQKYLRNEYECIQDYNVEAGEIAEPFRFLVIADFPANFSEAATKRLASILSSGARCGVFTLIAADVSGGAEAGVRARGGSARLPHWIPLEEIERAGNTLVWRDGEGAAGRFEWRDEDFGGYPLALESPPPQERLTAILHEVGQQAKDSTRVQVPFAAVAPPAGRLWSRSAAQEISVPLGRSGARKVQELTLGRGTAQHALIAGRTGSGKSNLLHVLISNAALWYSPEEVELYLVDFKKGVEFKSYAEHQLPHARVIAIESEREFGLSVLRRLDIELTRRGALFRDEGVQDLAGYRRDSGRVLPRILLIVDEFQEFFVEDDKVAQEASLLLDRLVRQGRAFGMHVVLGSQTLGGAYSIARSTIGQMAVRIALQCSDADCYLIMSEENNAPRLLSRPGEAIYNDASGMVEGNSPFQVVFLPDEVRDRWVPKATEALVAAGIRPPAAPIVFEGNLPARLEESGVVVEAIRSANGSATPTVWLGEPVSIKDPTSLSFQRQSGSNMLIVGQQDESALAMLTSAALSLRGAGASLSNGPAPGHAGGGLVILDGSAPHTPLSPVLEELAQHLPSPARVARPRQAAALVGELAAELDRREQEEQGGHGGFPPLFVILYGLQRFRDLRKADDFSFGGDDRGETAAAQFMRLLRDGPPLGIHTVAWCDTVANLDRTLERSALREFEARVLFQMSATDSTHLMDSPQAAMLGRHRAILYHEDAGTAERFRPWALPDEAARKRLLAGLRTGSAAPSR